MRRLVAVLFLMLIAAACASDAPSPEGRNAESLREGDEAPDFTLESPDGEISLGDYRGKKDVLLYFSMGPG